jgi:soluble lytic murein transglycosylase-like protein
MVKLIYWASCVMMIVISVILIVSQQPKVMAVENNPASIEAPTPDPITVRITEQNEPVNVYSEEIPLTPGWQAYTQDTCRRYGIDYALMLGLMETESSFRFDADSGWAYGICQIGYINEDVLATEGIDIYSRIGNIEAGCYILAGYLERYTESQALMAYNMGEYGASELWEQGIYESEYSRSVQEAAQKWRMIINGTIN